MNGPPHELPYVAAPDAFARPPIEVEWSPDIKFDPTATREIIEDVLVAGGMSVWYGEPGSGKTTLLLDAMLRMPRERQWLGKRVERCATIMVAAESASSPRMRVEAFRRVHGSDIGSFGLVPESLNLLSGTDVDDLVEAVLRESCRIPVPVGLIAIDTVARVMPGGDENSSIDMGRLVTGGDRIRRETGAHVAFVHHAGKDASKGARGHSSLRAATDTEIEVTFDKATKVHMLEVTKQRDLGSLGLQLSARFRVVEIGTNHWGKPITACVVEPIEEASAHIQAVMQQVDGERAEAAVLSGLRALIAMGVEPTDGPTTHRFLPRQLIDKSLADGFDRAALAAALNRLMRSGRLRVDVIGKYGNRGAKKGLVEVI